MKRSLLSALLLASLALSAQAHEIWIERDGAGPVRVYFGEPAQEVLDHGQDELKRVVAPEIFGAHGKAEAVVRKDDHLVAPLQGDGDAWLFDDKVFEPWQGEGGKYESVSYYARAGRQSTASKLDFELVPASAGGDVLTVLYRGKPLPDAEVTLIDPRKWTKQLKSDPQGRVALPALAEGRHIAVVAHKEPVQRQIAGKQVETIHHISTLTFLAE
ncbi:DUF4198 domain-containing protein [[Pseudomonas] boreopolis]|uniref:DUF4198 domain-containing protein n=1 Tax=Xanthomonas boreopolis TaxID=86183 RepID=UPI003DA19169